MPRETTITKYVLTYPSRASSTPLSMKGRTQGSGLPVIEKAGTLGPMYPGMYSGPGPVDFFLISFRSVIVALGAVFPMYPGL